MPLYDFRCKCCTRVFELLVRSDAAPICPECGGEPMERLLSAPAPQGQSAATIASARSQAAREGHFSNYSPSERPRS